LVLGAAMNIRKVMSPRIAIFLYIALSGLVILIRGYRSDNSIDVILGLSAFAVIFLLRKEFKSGNSN
jgi:hypothetical protein